MKNIQETTSSPEPPRETDRPPVKDVVVSPEQQGPFAVLRGWGVPIKRALSDLVSYPLEAVQKAIRVAQNTPNAKNPPALYTVALREGWNLPAAVCQADEKARKVAEFQARLAASAEPVQSREQPVCIASTLPSEEQSQGMSARCSVGCLDAKPVGEAASVVNVLDEETQAELRLEARRRVARLKGKGVDAVSEMSPAVEALMVTVAEERGFMFPPAPLNSLHGSPGQGSR